MDAEGWQRVESVLDRLLTSDRSEWPRLLEETCSGDPALRRQVEALLAQAPHAGDYLAAPPRAAAAALLDALDPPADLVGRRIGAWRLVRPVGRGGMSRVFLAERDDGLFAQQVAVKLLRADLDSEVDRARFAAERRILASLDHPHIARLLDGGVTEDGRPYLVLEYVDGRPIDRYCREQGLALRDRLALFATVAAATAHAHRSLVIHRDLKPSNILVTADGTVKLLDFGLAKLVDAEDGALATRTVTRWMTPEYAAPEQVQGRPVTTLTDVYQLGVVLYELLAGRLPFADRQNLHELEAAVLGEDPPPPSSFRPALRGDLDAIVLQAMQKEPGRRYQSVEALLEDLRRFGEGRPVRARRDSPGYRLRRFVGRNRVAVAGAGTALAALLFATAFSVAQMREARQQRDQANEEARRATAMLEVMNVLAGEDAVAGGEVLTPVERVEVAEEVLRARYRDHPALVVELMTELAGRLFDLTELPAQRRLLGRARAIALERDLNAQLAQVDCMRASAVLYDSEDLDSARAHLAEARAALSRAGLVFPTAKLDCAHAEGRVLLAEGRAGDAVEVLRRAAADTERSAGHIPWLETLNLLAEALREDGRPREAAEQHLRILREMAGSGYTHTDMLENVVAYTAAVLAELGELAVLDSLLHDVVARQERRRGPGRVGRPIAFLYGLTQLRLGRLDSADAWLEQAVAGGELTAIASWTPAAYAWLRLEQGRLDDARRAVARLPEGTPTRAINRALYGAWLRRGNGDTLGAAASLDSALGGEPSGVRPPAHATTALLLAAEWRLRGGRPAEADSLARLGRAAAAADPLALQRSAHVARAEMVIARSRGALGDRVAAREAAERAARASAAGNGMEHERTRAARALADSLR